MPAPTAPALRLLGLAGLCLAAWLPAAAHGQTITERTGLSGQLRASPEAQRDLYRHLEVGMMRVACEGLSQVWDFEADDLPPERRARPEWLDTQMRLAHELDREPVVNLIHSLRHQKESLYDVDWYVMGRAVADRYRQGGPWSRRHADADFRVHAYMLFNEVDADWYHPKGQEEASRDRLMADFARINAEFARGVRSVEPDARVYLGPLVNGFWPPAKYAAWRWVERCRDLFLSDGPERIDGFGLQIYPPDTGGQNYDIRADVNEQYQQIVDRAGVARARPAFYSTEFNVKVPSLGPASSSPPTMTEEQEHTAARMFLTHFFSHFLVGHKDGRRYEPALDFAMAFSPWFRGGQMASLNGDGLHTGGPWVPNRRGRVLQLATQLSEGFTIERIDPEAGQLLAASEDGRRMWVWLNQPDLTTERLGGGEATSMRLGGVPEGTRWLQAFHHDSALPGGEAFPLGLQVPTQTVAIDPDRDRHNLTGVRAGETVVVVSSPEALPPRGRVAFRVADGGRWLALDGRRVAATDDAEAAAVFLLRPCAGEPGAFNLISERTGQLLRVNGAQPVTADGDEDHPRARFRAEAVSRGVVGLSSAGGRPLTLDSDGGDLAVARDRDAAPVALEPVFLAPGQRPADAG